MIVVDGTKSRRVISFAGRMDAVGSAELEQIVTQELVNGYRDLVLDMSAVDYVSSKGLRMLVSLWKRAHDVKGELILSALQPAVQEVFNLIGFDLVFTIIDSLDDNTL